VIASKTVLALIDCVLVKRWKTWLICRQISPIR
jgi:hypothetical protein